jgi:hypothetical protein
VADHLRSVIDTLSPEDQAEVAALITDPDARPALMNLILLQQVLLRDEAADA